MGDPQVKRVRMRFFPEDEHALEQSLKLTTLTSQSNVLRAALMLFEEIWTHECNGVPVLFVRANEPLGRVLDVLNEPVPQEGRSKTSTSLEIRVTPNDAARIQRLLEAEAADTVSAIVRHAIRLYAVAVSRSKKGETLCARGQDNTETPLQVLGIGTPIKREKTTDGDRLPFGRGGYQSRIKTLWDLLPHSLSNDVRILVGKEGCDAEALIVDLVRSETLARLHGLDLHSQVSPLPERMPAEPVSPETASPIQQDETQQLFSRFFDSLGHMSENVNTILQLMEGPKRSKGQQATFSDLLFEVEGEMPAAADSVFQHTDNPDSPFQQCMARVEDLSQRIAKLLALSQQEQENKPRKRTRTENKNTSEAIPEDQALVPLSDTKGDWALVLATDEHGAPQQRVVGSQTIIPLSEEELSGTDH